MYDDHCLVCNTVGAPRRYVSRTRYECLGDRLMGVHSMPYGQVPEYADCLTLHVDHVELARQEREEKLRAEDDETEVARGHLRSTGGVERVCHCGRLATVRCTRCGEWVCNRIDACSHDVDGRLVCSECRSALDREGEERRERERRAADEQRERERRAAEEERERERRAAEERRRAAYEALPEVTAQELAEFAADGSMELQDGVTHRRLDRIPVPTMAIALREVHGAVDVAWPGREHDIERRSFSWLVLTPAGYLVERTFARPVTSSAPVVESVAPDGDADGRLTVFRMRSARPFDRLETEARHQLRRMERDDARREQRRRADAARWERRRLAAHFLRNLGIVGLLVPVVVLVVYLSSLVT